MLTPKGLLDEQERGLKAIADEADEALDRGSVEWSIHRNYQYASLAMFLITKIIQILEADEGRSRE